MSYQTVEAGTWVRGECNVSEAARALLSQHGYHVGTVVLHNLRVTSQVPGLVYRRGSPSQRGSLRTRDEQVLT